MVSERAEQPAFQAPTGIDTSAGGVPGANDHVCLVRPFEHRGHLLRRMRQIGVHLHDEVAPVIQRPSEPGYVRCPKALLARPGDDLDATVIAFAEGAGHVSRPVRRAIVHDVQVEVADTQGEESSG